MTTGCSRWYVDYGLDKDQLSSKEALPVLILALDDPSAPTRRNALRCICRLQSDGQEAIPKVIELAKNDLDQEVRGYAIRTLREVMLYSQHNIDSMLEIAVANSHDSRNSAEAKRALTTIEKKSADYGLVRLGDGVEIKMTPAFKFFNGYTTIRPSRAWSILPVDIEISNQTTAPLSLTAESFTLLDTEGEQKSQIPVEAAIKKQQYDIGAAVLRGLVILGPIPAIKAGRANGVISKFCEAKVLTTLEVQPGEHVEKVIFFNCPSRPQHIVGWQLDFNCLQKGCGKDTHIQYTFGSGAEISFTQFSPELKLSPTPTSLENRLLELKALKDKELITEEEYKEKRKSLISEL